MSKPVTNPTHRQTLYIPGGGEKVFETKPTGRAKGLKAYCKYCYRTHRQWWQMREEDYGADVILCGYCEYTSLKENAVEEAG